MEDRLEVNVEISSDEEDDELVTLRESASPEDDDLTELLSDTEAYGDTSSSEGSDLEDGVEEGGASEGATKRKTSCCHLGNSCQEAERSCCLSCLQH